MNENETPAVNKPSAPVVYISGPLTSGTSGRAFIENVAAALDAGITMLERGAVPLVPHTNILMGLRAAHRVRDVACAGLGAPASVRRAVASPRRVGGRGPGSRRGAPARHSGVLLGRDAARRPRHAGTCRGHPSVVCADERTGGRLADLRKVTHDRE